MRRYFDHIDLRVRSIEEARPFYDLLLPALGFTHDAKIEGWVQYEAVGTTGMPEFFGLTESPRHLANECRIAFWTDSNAEVERLAAIAVKAGAGGVSYFDFLFHGMALMFSAKRRPLLVRCIVSFR